MPPAIIGAVGGALISGLFGQQQQNQQIQAQQGAQSTADQFAAQQQQQAIAAMQQARAQAMQQFQSYIQSNPNPVNAWAGSGVVGPTNTAPGQVGGGMMGANGTPAWMAPTPQFNGNPQDGANLEAFLRMMAPPPSSAPAPGASAPPSSGTKTTLPLPGGIGRIPLPPINPGGGGIVHIPHMVRL